MAAKRTTLVASQAFTTAGNSVDLPILTGTMMAVGVDISAGSGTISDFDIWMEGSVDGGVTWARLTAERIVGDENGTITDVTTPRSNIINNKATNTIARYLALYPWLPCDTVRARWTLTGTTPSLTFSVNVGVK